MAAPPTDIRDQAHNLVAIASLAYQQELMALTRMLACARSHGLDVGDLVRASGLPPALITELLEKADH